MTHHETTLCKACGAPIIWIKDQTGTKVPLNKTRVRVYWYDEPQKRWRLESRGVWKSGTEPLLVYVSHFLTCPKASEFSKEVSDGA